MVPLFSIQDMRDDDPEIPTWLLVFLMALVIGTLVLMDLHKLYR